MSKPILLWIDLRCENSALSPFSSFSESWVIHRINLVQSIISNIQEHSPHFLCFEFDHPYFQGLKAIKNTKLQFPGLPILMLTEYHSADLALWALRARVWDYLVKPVTIEDLSHRLDTLFKICHQRNGSDVRTNYLPPGRIPIECKFRKPSVRIEITLPALFFINKNFQDRIKIKDVAKHCNLKPVQFSLAFKKEQGMTFRAYLLQYRIDKARELLNNPYASVTEVVLAVGFNDLSDFSCLFKRYVGVTPSKYRQCKTF